MAQFTSGPRVCSRTGENIFPARIWLSGNPESWETLEPAVPPPPKGVRSTLSVFLVQRGDRGSA